MRLKPLQKQQSSCQRTQKVPNSNSISWLGYEAATPVVHHYEWTGSPFASYPLHPSGTRISRVKSWRNFNNMKKLDAEAAKLSVDF